MMDWLNISSVNTLEDMHFDAIGGRKESRTFESEPSDIFKLSIR